MPVVLQLYLLFVNLRLDCRELRLGVLVRRLRLIELRAADRAGVVQLLQPRQLLACVSQIGLARRALRLGRRHRRLLPVRIDLDERAPRGYAVARLHEDLAHEPFHLRLHDRRTEGTDRRDVLGRLRERLRLERDGLHLHRRKRTASAAGPADAFTRRLSLAAAARARTDREKDEKRTQQSRHGNLVMLPDTRERPAGFRPAGGGLKRAGYRKMLFRLSPNALNKPWTARCACCLKLPEWIGQRRRGTSSPSLKYST